VSETSISAPPRRGAISTTVVRGEAHAIVETCKSGFLLSWSDPAAQLAAGYIPLHDCVTRYLLICFLHVRIFKSRTREKTVRIIVKMRAVTFLLRAHSLVVLTSLSLSSWSPHTVQQIFDSFTHEPPVLARQHVGRQDPRARKARRCIDSSPCTYHMDQCGHLRDAVSQFTTSPYIPIRCLPLPGVDIPCHVTCIHIQTLKQTTHIFTNSLTPTLKSADQPPTKNPNTTSKP
jgi:hypothetical protein